MGAFDILKIKGLEKIQKTYKKVVEPAVKYSSHDLKQGESFRFSSPTEAKMHLSSKVVNQYTKQGITPKGFTGTSQGGILHTNEYEARSGYKKRAVIMDKDKGIYSDAPVSYFNCYEDIRILGDKGLQRIDFGYLTGRNEDILSREVYAGNVAVYGAREPTPVTKYGGGELQELKWFDKTGTGTGIFKRGSVVDETQETGNLSIANMVLLAGAGIGAIYLMKKK